MPNWDDWQIILELDRRGGYDGLIADDADMLALPNEMVALARTSLCLVIAAAAGQSRDQGDRAVDDLSASDHQ